MRKKTNVFWKRTIAMLCTAAVLFGIIPADSLFAAASGNGNITILDSGGSEVSELSLTVGESLALDAETTGEYEEWGVSWQSDDSGIVAVNGGVVEAVSPGEAAVTVTAENPEDDTDTVSASCIVTVSYAKITGISLSESEKSLYVGADAELAATVEADGIYNPDIQVNWSSSASETVEISGEGLKATITAKKPGEAQITAAIQDGEDEFAASCKVTASYAEVSGISLDVSSATLYINGNKEVELTAGLSADGLLDPELAVEWETSDESVAEAVKDTNDSCKASVVAKGKGTAEITVRAGGKEAVCKVTVKTLIEEVTLDQQSADLNLNPEKGTDRITLQAVLKPDLNEKEVSISWNSNTNAVFVEPDAADPAKAYVTASKAGEAKVSVTVKTDAVEKTAFCDITVKADAESVKIQTDGQTDKYYPADMETIKMKAETVPEQAYCNDGIEWSVEGSDHVQIDPSTGELMFFGLDSEEETVTVTATAGKVSDSFPITLKKKAVSIAIAELQTALTYGDSGRKLKVAVKDIDGNEIAKAKTGKVTFIQISGKDAAAVAEDGSITILKAGSFRVKAAVSANGYYNAAESEEVELIIQPKTLNIKLAENENNPITKASDGTALLLEKNKVVVKTLLSLEGIVGNDAVQLDIQEEALDSLRFLSGAMGTTKIDLSGLQNGLFISGDDSSNYILDTAAVCTEIGAKITANEPKLEEADTDMCLRAEDIVLKGSEADGVILRAGAEGNEKNEGKGDQYWYDEEGMPIDIGSSYEVVNLDGNSLEVPLTKSGTSFYIIDKSDDRLEYAVYYGPYTVKFQCDSEAPDISYENITGILFGNGDITYKVTVRDDESGVKKLQYYVGGSEPDANTKWTEVIFEPVEGEENTYQFTVTVPASGVLYVQAEDAVGNTKTSDGIRTLVLEKDAPVITSIRLDENEQLQETPENEPKKEHTVTVSAQDAEEEGSNPYMYSGISKVYYTLSGYSMEEEGYVPLDQQSDVVWKENKIPQNMEEIPSVRVVESLELNFSEEEFGELNGAYELTVWTVDFCGNESEKKAIEINFDNESPKLQVDFSPCQGSLDEKDYYNNDFIVTFTVTDNYPLSKNYFIPMEDSDRIKFDEPVFSDNGKTYTVQAKVFKDKYPEGEYSFSISGTDTSGNPLMSDTEKNIGENETEEKDSEWKTRIKVLDKTAPKLKSVVYPGNTNQYNGKYYFGINAERRQISLSLTEKNFNEAEANEYLSITADLVGQETSQKLAKEEYSIEWSDGNEENEHIALITLPNSDGEYVLTLDYRDLAENKLEGVGVKDGTYTSAGMVIDNAAPMLESVFYPGNTHEGSNGNYYYGLDAKSHQISLTLTEKNFDETEANKYISMTEAVEERELDKKEYGIEWSDGNAKDEHVALITLPDEEGTYRLNFAYQDLATNKLDGDGVVSGIFTSAYMIIDKTCPVITGITSTGKAKGPYDTKDGVSDYYYNDKNVVIILNIQDENLPEKEGEIWTASAKCDGKKVSADVVDIQKDRISFTLEEGKYTGLTVSGTDMAGNPLILKMENDKEAYQHSEWDTAEAAVIGNEGVVVLKHGKVLDHTAPVAEITYISEDAPNLYDGEDGRVAAAYYNKDITARIRITDSYGSSETVCGVDREKLFVAQNMSSGNKITETNLVYQIGVDGRNYFTVYGTDRAGNALTVKEQTPGSNVVLTTDNCEKSYETKYTLVRDTQAPTFVLAVTPTSSVSNKEQQNGRYYFNGSYTATVTVDDENFDDARIQVKKGGVTSGTYDTSSDTVESFRTMVAYSGNQQYVDQADKTNGIYRYQVYGTDKAGNALTASDRINLESSVAVEDQDEEDTADMSCHIVVDTVKPTGVLSIGDYYRILVESGTVELSEPYRKERSASIQITSEDRSPVRIAYTVDSTVSGEKNYSSKDYAYSQKAKSSVSGEQVFQVKSVRLTDRAGNQILLKKTNRIYLDVTAPSMDELAPTISVVADANTDDHGPEGTPLFNDSVPLHIEVSEPYAGTKSSGLSEVTYHLYINGEEVSEDQRTLNPASTKAWNHKYTDPTLVYEIDETIEVGASDHNYNDIRIVVDAEDNAGNKNSRSYEFGIDITSPVIEIEYDNNEAENEKYFKADRIATITVTERNFSSDLIDISTESTNISGWSYSAGSSSNGDDDQWTAEVIYSTDGEYTLNVSGEDLLGQNADDITYNGTAPQEFVIDKTAPVLTMEFDRNDPANGKYYNSNRTATLTVDDVNFNGVSDIAVNASGGGAAPVFNFSGNTSSVTFGIDGVYSFSGTVTDMAGNVSLPIDCEEFVIDQTAPIITFHNVENMTAYGRSEDAFAPYISIEDTNFDPAGVTVTMTKARWDSEEELNGFGSLNGSSWYLDAIEETPENDAVYTLFVQVQDMAGNPNTEEDSISFSLNRFGSVYLLGEDTKELLDRYYTRESETLELTEYNLSNQADSWIDVSRNSEEEIRLAKDSDYTVSVTGDSGNDCNWKMTEYRINGANFEADGTYKVIVYSKDALMNATTNENPASEDYASVIEFCKDTVAPTLTLTGVEEGGSYDESEMILLINYFDNSEMSSLDVLVVNAEDESDVISSARYTVEDGSLEPVSGKLEYTLKEDSRMQKVIVTAMDRAGNPGTPEELAVVRQTVTFTMTTNPFIRFYRNTPVFICTIVICAAVFILILALLLWKRRRKEKTEE